MQAMAQTDFGGPEAVFPQDVPEAISGSRDLVTPGAHRHHRPALEDARRNTERAGESVVNVTTAEIAEYIKAAAGELPPLPKGPFR
ncbi:hypothetical protein [Streptomyces sp. NPDC005953]|uniref:hypothetical protein n=2 Tax=unclassified Streptomyces TaxID=2593676 RepID=UPI0033F27E63